MKRSKNYHDALMWTHKVMMSCTTISQLLQAEKLCELLFTQYGVRNNLSPTEVEFRIHDILDIHDLLHKCFDQITKKQP